MPGRPRPRWSALKSLDGIEIAWAAQMACLLEVSVDKPGNVSPRAGFCDTCYEDFLASAAAIGPAFLDSPQATVGETILRAVKDTRRFVSSNTNLGIVLLLAPLAKAAGICAPSEGLRAAVAGVLQDLTVADARHAYRAIRTAAPAALGVAARHDVHGPAVETTLLEAMTSARGHDSVAHEYATGYDITFDVGCETLRRSHQGGDNLSASILQTFLTILARVPDTLIARKKGRDAAKEVSRRAARVLAAGGSLSAEGRRELMLFDRGLRDDTHAMNPGTTADLTCAALFACLVDGSVRVSSTSLAVSR